MKNRAAKEQKRGECYYADNHLFREENVELPDSHRVISNLFMSQKMIWKGEEYCATARTRLDELGRQLNPRLAHPILTTSVPPQ